MQRKGSRSNDEWLADLGAQDTRAEALADLRDYLLRAVYVYMDRHREDLSDLGRSELEQMAEDFAQEALLQVLERLDTFRGESKFTTWAYRFVINVAAGELRLRRWRTLSMEAVVGQEEVSLLHFLSDTAAPDPETAAARVEIAALMKRVIRHELTERQRIALINVKLRGVPVDVVAEELDTNRNNIYKLVYDARKKLKEGLERRHYSQADVLAIFSRR
jgi:RNA polymerase sigma-70 factor (ECF subfamily)